jgi:hypothetical protein
MTNQKDEHPSQGASQILPNTHFQDDSLTDHDVLKTKTDVCVTSYKSPDPYQGKPAGMVVRWLLAAWQEVTPTTVENCWIKGVTAPGWGSGAGY